MFLGALGAATALGYMARGLTSRGAPAPLPEDGHPALVAQEQAPDEAERDTAKTSAAAALPADSTDDEVEEDLDVGQKPEALPEGAAIADDGSFYVQVAAYKSQKDAAQYATMLSARGLSAREQSRDGSSWHLVRLGPFKNRVDAEKARFDLKPQEREKAYVEPRSNGKYHVQVGSFATLEQAEPVAKQLAARGHVTKISRIKMGDRRWYCVRIGPFDTADEAAGYQELVKSVPGAQPVVIPYGPPRQ